MADRRIMLARIRGRRDTRGKKLGSSPREIDAQRRDVLHLVLLVLVFVFVLFLPSTSFFSSSTSSSSFSSSSSSTSSVSRERENRSVSGPEARTLDLSFSFSPLGRQRAVNLRPRAIAPGFVLFFSFSLPLFRVSPSSPCVLPSRFFVLHSPPSSRSASYLGSFPRLSPCVCTYPVPPITFTSFYRPPVVYITGTFTLYRVSHCS